MIKIIPYILLPNSREIYKLYISMVAKVLPFLVEDCLWNSGIAITDIHKTVRNREGNRSDSRIYNELLQKYLKNTRIPNGKKSEQNRWEDALLAREIIRTHVPALFAFLYEGFAEDPYGHINAARLHLLLTSPMNSDKSNLPFSIAPINDDKVSNLLLKNVFRYQTFANQSNIYRLVQMLNVPVCPYCNRQYTSTIAGKDTKVRPELDHYKSKSKYPWFSVSILNLVPSCSTCNRSKGDSIEQVLYPYAEEMGNTYSFNVNPLNGAITEFLTGARVSPSDFEITLSNSTTDYNQENDDGINQRIENSIRIFKLRSLYQSHRPYVSNLLFLRYMLTDELIEDILQLFPELFQSEADVRHAILLDSPSEKRKEGEMPLDKLKNDILREIDILYTK